MAWQGRGVVLPAYHRGPVPQCIPGTGYRYRTLVWLGVVGVASENHGENRWCSRRWPPNSAFKNEDPFLKWEVQSQFPKERNPHGPQGYTPRSRSDKCNPRPGGPAGRTQEACAGVGAAVSQHGGDAQEFLGFGERTGGSDAGGV